MKPRLYERIDLHEAVSAPARGLTPTARAEAELNGQRNARGAFERIAAHGYAPADPAFRELGTIMLANRVKDWGLPQPIAEAWLVSALAQFDALVSGCAFSNGVQ